MPGFDPERGGPMMRRAGSSPEHMIKPISRFYCSTSCLEGQNSIRLIPAATRPRSGRSPRAAACRAATLREGVTGPLGP